jgi:ABC-type transport system substrate-binding protein
MQAIFSASTAFALLGLTAPAFAAVTVSGWPFAFPGDPGKGELPHAGDGVFGRLACPSLTRLNLKAKKSEPLLLRDLEVESPKQWKLVLKSGLYWWSGKPVDGPELAAYLRENMCTAVRSILGGDASCPSFDVAETPPAKGAGATVRVVWREPPQFGPYLFNNLPFFRTVSTGSVSPEQPAQTPSVECAGLYAYGPAAPGWVDLMPSKGYPATRRTPIRIQAASQSASGGGASPVLAFSFASEMSKGQKCRRAVPFPSVVGISWREGNPGGLVSSPQVRKALTQILPRGELSRAGTQGLGELVTSVIPRQHPGYNAALRIRPYSVDEASAALDRLGWHRATADSPRLDRKTGKPVVLKLATSGPQSPGSELLQKVIGDSFALIGIRTEFVPSTDPAVDGIIGNLSPDWPDINFLSVLPRSAALNGSMLSRDPATMRLLKSYALSLTTMAPDFTLLQKIHERLYDAEVFSPVLQVGVCVDRSLKASTKPDFADPDWFRLLVL